MTLTTESSAIDEIIREITEGPLSGYLTLRGVYRFEGEECAHIRAEDKQGIYWFISDMEKLEQVEDYFCGEDRKYQQ